jgi:hypothetical protein
MRVDDIDAAFEKAAGGADYDQADWAVYFNKALLNTFSFVSDYVFSTAWRRRCASRT